MAIFNKKELQKEMIDRDCSVENLGDILGISRQGTYRKINCEVAFSVNDIRLIKKAWSLSDKRVREIFLI